MDVTGAKWTEGKNYTLTVNDLPTPESGKKVDTNLNSLVLSVGDLKSGSLGFSSTSLWTV